MAIGLFGTPIGAQSDQDIVDRIRQEQELRNQRLTQGLGKYAGLAASGMEAAQGFNTAVSKLFGIQDPRLQKNSAIREAGDAVKARGVNLQDSLATLTAFSEELMKRGLYQEATALMPQIQQAQRQKAQDARAVRSEEREDRKLEIDEETLGIKTAEGMRKATEAGVKAQRETVDFYKKNPEQATIELQNLARQIQADPTNKTLLDRYEAVASASSMGAMEATAKQEEGVSKAEESKANIARIKAQTNKYNKEIADINNNAKFTPAQRWNEEREAALKFFEVLGQDPNKPLTQSQLAINPNLVNIQQRALRNKLSDGAAPPASTPAPVPTPASTTIRYNAKGERIN